MHYEGWDCFLPSQKGFVTDFIFALRGTKVPTSFAAWCALSALSTILKREVKLDWYPKPLYTNFYLLLVAPPSICGKDTVINFVQEVLTRAPGFISNPNVKTMKRLKFVANKGTQQYIAQQLSVKKIELPFFVLDDLGNATDIPLTDEHGKPETYPVTSEAIILAPEFGVFMGKETYNEGLVQFLLDLYNTHEVWETGTKTDGKVYLRRMHTTLIGGTTPDAIRDSIPKAVSGDGFLSRTMIAYHGMAARRVPIPQPVTGAPSMDELASRLAWIAEHCQGKYTLTSEAKSYYVKWHGHFSDDLEKYPELVGIQSRMDVNILKFSLLMCAQRYTDSRDITLNDVQDAERMLKGTMSNSRAVLGEITGGVVYKKMQTISRFLAKNGKSDRVTLLRATSKRISAWDITQVLNDLRERGLVRILRDKAEQSYASSNGKETYEWTGKQEDLP